MEVKLLNVFGEIHSSKIRTVQCTVRVCIVIYTFLNEIHSLVKLSMETKWTGTERRGGGFKNRATVKRRTISVYIVSSFDVSVCVCEWKEDDQQNNSLNDIFLSTFFSFNFYFLRLSISTCSNLLSMIE